MLKRLLLYLSSAKWARQTATHWGLARRVARRFVAGETFEEAIAATRELNAYGILVTLDDLGESSESAEDTQEVVSTYLHILDGIHQNQLQSSVSLKLTHLGLDINEELCVNKLRQILTRAQQHNIPVTIDMESSAYVDTTLRIYRTMRDEHGFTNVGTVIQSYLRRSEEDMRQLAQEDAHIRLVKGAYLEPPEVAFPEKADVDAQFIDLMRQYLTAGTEAYLCIATHDDQMIKAAETLIREHHIPLERFEFQMLYGIRRPRQRELAAQYKMRVYLPFGSAWYPYFMRRLAERPANLWFFIRSLLSR